MGGGHCRKFRRAAHKLAHSGLCLLVCLLTLRVLQTVAHALFVYVGYVGAYHLVLPRKLYVTVAASGINLMKASMDEKLNLVMTLKDSIENARRIIDNANLYCYLVTDCGWKPDYIWEILTSDVKDEIVTAVIGKWNK